MLTGWIDKLRVRFLLTDKFKYRSQHRNLIEYLPFYFHHNHQKNAAAIISYTERSLPTIRNFSQSFICLKSYFTSRVRPTLPFLAPSARSESTYQGKEHTNIPCTLRRPNTCPAHFPRRSLQVIWHMTERDVEVVRRCIKCQLFTPDVTDPVCTLQIPRCSTEILGLVGSNSDEAIIIM